MSGHVLHPHGGMVVSYGAWQHDPAQMRVRVIAAMCNIPALMQEYNADGLVVTGSSGCMFMAALVASGFPARWLKVRKPSDVSTSHGRPIEGHPWHRYSRLIFVDDDIISGDTRERVVRTLKEHLPEAVVVGDYLFGLGEWVEAKCSA